MKADEVTWLLTPGLTLSQRGLGVGCYGRKRAYGDSEGEADRKSQWPDLRFKGQRSGRGHTKSYICCWYTSKKKKWNLWTFISQLRSCSININISDVDWFLSYLWLLVLTIDGLWPSWISSWRRRSVCPCRLLHRLKDNRKSIINRKCHQCVCVWDSEV